MKRIALESKRIRNNSTVLFSSKSVLIVLSSVGFYIRCGTTLLIIIHFMLEDASEIRLSAPNSRIQLSIRHVSTHCCFWTPNALVKVAVRHKKNDSNNLLKILSMVQHSLNLLSVMALVIFTTLRECGEVYPAICDDPSSILGEVDDGAFTVEEEKVFAGCDGEGWIACFGVGGDFGADLGGQDLWL